MKQGIVEYYNKDKGYGFIQYHESTHIEKVFFHHTVIRPAEWSPKPGDQVSFNNVTRTPKGLKAFYVEFLQKGEAGNNPQLKATPCPEEAFAPYNFIPLNEFNVEAPTIEVAKTNLFTCFDESLITGFIHLDISTLTPFYIRGTRKSADDEASPFFFSPGGSVRIPGSSLRGMLRTLIEIVSFGKFGFYTNSKIYHDSSVSDHIKQKPTCSDTIKKCFDIAESSFGIENSLPSRLFVEDAFIQDTNPECYENQGKSTILKRLYTPNSDAFRLYFERNDEIQKEHPQEPSEYKSEGLIRGNKLYWHQSPEKIKWGKADQDPQKFRPGVESKIVPIKAGIKFSGRIRFENFTDAELGAILFTLNLPKGCCHKLGMGKPLGLGSIQINPHLFISKRKERYSKLSAEWKSQIYESSEETIKGLKNHFAKYILSKIKNEIINGKDEWEILWGIGRMQELKRMLAFTIGKSPDGRPDDKYLKYMSRNDSIKKNILPCPTKVGAGTSTSGGKHEKRDQ